MIFWGYTVFCLGLGSMLTLLVLEFFESKNK